MENIKTLIQENKDCKMEKGVLCAQHCRDCRYMEMSNKKGAAVLWNVVTGYPYGKTVKCARTAITVTISIAK